MIRQAEAQMKRGFPLRSALWSVGIIWGALMLGLVGLIWYINRDNAGTLAKGQMAPSFALPDQDGRTHRLADYQGRGVALIFLPGVDSLSREQLRSVNRSISGFDTLGVKVFGITTLASKLTKPVHDEEKLEFPILTDNGNRLGQQYGVGTADVRTGRISYVVGPDGKVLLPVLDVQVAQHGQQMIAMTECCLDTKTQASKAMGKTIEDFSLPNVQTDKPETLYGTKRAKATVLFFVSAECPCSAKYDSRSLELARQYASRGVRFVAVNSSAGEQTGAIAEHARKVGYPYAMLKDERNIVADRFEAQVTPEVFVMDEKGVLRYHGRVDDNRDVTKVTSNDLRNALDALLAGQIPSRPEMPAFGCAIARDKNLFQP